jgi:hypothetical protein
VNDDLDGIDIGPEQVLASKPVVRHSLALAIGVVLLVFLAGGTAYVWLNYSSQVRAAVLSAMPGDAPVVARSEEAIGCSDFEAFKQQSSELLRSTIAGFDAQKEEFKRRSDRLSSLESRVDVIQPALSTPTTVAAPAQIATVASPSTMMP